MKATKIISECELFRLFSLCGEAFSSDEISTRLETAIEHFVERISRLLRKRPVIDQLRLLAHLCGYLERMKYRYAEEPIKKGIFRNDHRTRRDRTTNPAGAVALSCSGDSAEQAYPLAVLLVRRVHPDRPDGADLGAPCVGCDPQGRRYACRIEQARPHFRTAAECFVQESRPLPQCRA